MKKIIAITFLPPITAWNGQNNRKATANQKRDENSQWHSGWEAAHRLDHSYIKTNGFSMLQHLFRDAISATNQPNVRFILHEAHDTPADIFTHVLIVQAIRDIRKDEKIRGPPPLDGCACPERVNHRPGLDATP